MKRMPTTAAAFLGLLVGVFGVLPGVFGVLPGVDPQQVEPAREAERLEGQEEVILGHAADWKLDDTGLDRETLVVDAGTPLLEEPWDDARIVTEAPGGALAIWEAVPGWRRVISGSIIGWVKLDASPDLGFPDEYPTAEPAVEASPPLPTPIGDPSDRARTQLLARARELLGEGVLTARLGPFELLTNSNDRGLLAFLHRVAESTVVSYAKTHELTGKDSRGAVVLFATEAEYNALRDRVILRPSELVGAFEMAGVAVLFSENLERTEIARNLIHELTHVLNGERLAPRTSPGSLYLDSMLAPWLEEGTATNMAFSSLDRRGGLHPLRLAKDVKTFAGITHIGGASAGLLQVSQALVNGQLPPLTDLVDMGREEFGHGAEAALLYLQSATLIRYLLQNRELRAPFLGFLQAVASGDRRSTELFEMLPISPNELEDRHRNWTIELTKREAL